MSEKIKKSSKTASKSKPKTLKKIKEEVQAENEEFGSSAEECSQETKTVAKNEQKDKEVRWTGGNFSPKMSIN